MSIWLFLAAAAVLAAAAYLTSLWVHPWQPCRSCDGSGRTRDRLWRGAFGTCKACGGRGRKPRPGIRVLQPGRARRMAAAEAKHKITDERRG